MKNAFTLLELVIVIIIVGVLTALALPRYFYVIEEAKATEGINAIASIREGMDRCYMMHGGSYTNCNAGIFTPGGGWGSLEMSNPGDAPGAHFWYFSVGYNDSYLICGVKENGTAVGWCYYLCMGQGVKPIFMQSGSWYCMSVLQITHDNKIYWGSDPQISTLLPNENQ